MLLVRKMQGDRFHTATLASVAVRRSHFFPHCVFRVTPVRMRSIHVCKR